MYLPYHMRFRHFWVHVIVGIKDSWRFRRFKGFNNFYCCSNDRYMFNQNTYSYITQVKLHIHIRHIPQDFIQGGLLKPYGYSIENNIPEFYRFGVLVKGRERYRSIIELLFIFYTIIDTNLQHILIVAVKNWVGYVTQFLNRFKK